MTKIKEYLKENRWLVAVAIVFIAWKLFLVGVLWHDRLSPPEPDDSYIYIGHIESFRQCPQLFCEDAIYPMESFGGWTHLVYRIFFGSLALISGIDSESMYHWSFYIGSVMLLAVLLFFLKAFTDDSKFIAFMLLFLLIPNGGGSAHSFNWIVPGFFSLLLYFLILSIVIKKESKNWKWMLPVLAFLMLYTHTIGIYFCAGLVLFVVIFSILERKVDPLMVKKTLLLLFSLAVFYVSVTFYLEEISINSKGNSYGPERFIGQTMSNISDGETGAPADSSNHSYFPGYPQIHGNYLKWVVLNPLGLMVLVIFLYMNYRYKQTKILALFLSSILFLLLASVHKFGFRYLVILWPITVMFYASGFLYFWKWINEIDLPIWAKSVMRFGWALAVTAVLLLGLTFSFLWNVYAAQKKNYDIKKEYAEYLKKNITNNHEISYTSKTVNSLLIKDNLRNKKNSNSQVPKKYFLYLNEENEHDSYDKSALNSFLDRISKKTSIQRATKNPVNYESGEVKRNDHLGDLEKNYFLEAEFGDLKIFRIDN